MNTNIKRMVKYGPYLLLLGTIFLYACKQEKNDDHTIPPEANDTAQMNKNIYSFKNEQYQLHKDFEAIDTSYYSYFDVLTDSNIDLPKGPEYFQVYKAAKECYISVEIFAYSVEKLRELVRDVNIHKQYIEKWLDTSIVSFTHKYDKNNQIEYAVIEKFEPQKYSLSIEKHTDSLSIMGELRCLDYEAYKKYKDFQDGFFPGWP